MNSDTKKFAFITGASAGIGYEFAKVFAENNYNLLLTARNREELNNIKNELESDFGIEVKFFVADLSDIEQTKLLCRELDESGIIIDVLVNNAGAGLYGKHVNIDTEREIDIITLNIISLTYLTKHVLNGMIQRKSGHILNIASTAAFKPGPMMTVYYATKSYVYTYSESLAAELYNTGVYVTAFCPGPTATGFFKKAAAGKAKDMKFKKYMTAREAALHGYNTMVKKKLIAVPGFTNKMINLVFKFLPRKMIGTLLFKMKDK